MRQWFNPKLDKKLIELLKKSGSNFDFDPNQVKYRLLSSIDQIDQKPTRHWNYSRTIKYSAVFASLILILSGTFTFASNAKPGDKLFALNKLGEQIILNLPLSVEQKAKVEEHIVTNRLEALDQVQLKAEELDKKTDDKKLQTIQESDESLTKAVDSISAKKKILEDSGKPEAAAKLEAVLDNLQTKAAKQETIIKNLEEKTTNKDSKAKIRKHLEQIKASREKAKSEIKRFKEEKNQQQDHED